MTIYVLLTAIKVLFENVFVKKILSNIRMNQKMNIDSSNGLKMVIFVQRFPLTVIIKRISRLSGFRC